ncbi:MAG: hypothetical protein JXA20_17820 [Spirochaetes bacterium]|nr:hypothetical protein [Spirochaetota bacterium]
MAFRKVPGFPGKLYVPDEVARAEKKHDCKDCFSCGWCDDERCRLCLKGKKCDRCGDRQEGDDSGSAPEGTGTVP